MTTMRARFIYDLLLSALLIFEMFIQYTGNFLHEVIGLLFFITIIAHNVLSKKWYGSTAKQLTNKRLKRQNALRLVLVAALVICSIALAVSSIAISQVLFDAFGLNLAGSGYSVWVVIHTVSSYGLCIIVVAHLAVHWMAAAAAFKIPYDPSRRQAISTGVTAVAAIGAVLLVGNGAQAVAANLDKVSATESGDASDLGNGSGSGNGYGYGSDSSSSTNEYGEGYGRHRGYGDHDGQGKHLHHRSTDYDDDSASAEDGASESSSSSSANSSSSSSSSSSSGSSSSSSKNSGGTSTSGICTLCKKRCPLSAPECNKPYRAGLL